MKKNYNYNDLVRFYNRSLKKLNSLLSLGKNEYKQDILKRRIARLFEVLKGMQTQIKLSHATVALSAGFMLFNSNNANAQTFAPKVMNPAGLTAVPTASAWSTPWYVDLDNDGDKDIMSGTGYAGDFYYYQNTGTAAAPSYSAPVLNPFSLTGVGVGQYAQPSFVDIDNDGDLDMFSGSGVGDIWYWENIGTASAPNFNTGYTGAFGLTTVPDPYGYSAGSFVDLDNDGDMDFMSGSAYGNFYYYQNTGTASAPSFMAPTMNSYGLSAITGGYFSTATFVDLDGDGDKDLFSGDGDSFDYFQNTGTASAPAFGAIVTNPFSLTAVLTGTNGASASFGDMDNDGDMDLISGIAPGDIYYFENTSPLGIANIQEVSGVSVYPNPTTTNVTLKLNNTTEALNVQVTNVLGQVVSTSVINNSTNVIELPEAKGMYFVKVTSKAEDKSSVFKITKN